jgi:hypothetical protein
MNHRNLSLGGSALEEYIVVRVRSDHHTRLRKLSAFFSSSATTWPCVLRTQDLLGCFHIIRMEFRTVKDVKKYRIATALIQATGDFQ